MTNRQKIFELGMHPSSLDIGITKEGDKRIPSIKFAGAPLDDVSRLVKKHHEAMDFATPQQLITEWLNKRYISWKFYKEETT